MAIWIQTSEWAWRAFGTLALLTLAGSHARLVLSLRRTTDSALNANLTVVSVLTSSAEATLAAIAVVGLVHHVTSSEIRLAAVLVITMLLSIALPPILRGHATNQRARSVAPSMRHDPPEPICGVRHRLRASLNTAT